MIADVCQKLDKADFV